MEYINKKTLHTYIALLAVTVFALYVIQVFNIAYPVVIKNSNVSSELAVIGEGKIDVVPDSASIEVGISVSNAKTARDAQQQVNTINTSILESLKSLSIQKKDIKTSNYSVYPNYNYNDKDNPNTITGYNANVNLTIKTKKIDTVFLIIDKTTDAGANQVYGVSYSVDTPEQFRKTARLKAIENAKQQATELSSMLGIRLGKVVNIIESNTTSDMPLYAKSESLPMGGGGGPSIEPGTQSISSTVTLYFEKK